MLRDELQRSRLACLSTAFDTGLQHERGEVRQMSSALLNNFSLLLANTINSRGSSEMSDEATQVLFGALDGLQDETSQVRQSFISQLGQSSIGPMRVCVTTILCCTASLSVASFRRTDIFSAAAAAALTAMTAVGLSPSSSIGSPVDPSKRAGIIEPRQRCRLA